ncbi:MAG: hypothetical protein OEV40_31260 [Acidimicrobiia bacterium]|nr:hypothetical protein [Acidimicrobiia bacterium]
MAPEVEFTVDALGVSPDQALGSTPALGSGCSPNAEDLPDGVWFGWVTGAGSERLDFDLACLWPGRLDPASSNDAARIRQVPVAPTAAVHVGDEAPLSYDRWALGSIAPPAANAPGLPQTEPYWLFINDGTVTEIARHVEPIRWARSLAAWPGLSPGCCDAGDVVPPSPDDPWPAEGWPVDGFYAPVVERRSETEYELSIQRWLSCRDNPGLCPDYWVGDEVTIDPDAPLIRRQLFFDEDLTVVIMPIFDESPLVGDGIAFRSLLADLDEAISDWAGDDEFAWPDELQDRTADPDFPFGVTSWPNNGGEGPIGYRGPGGSHLTPPDTWWTALEIRNAKPVLYIHAGLVAG